ncbi:hypothetical protein ACTID9_23650 [Brevibacillus fluminis]|uniref:hypothetical protein n=1 Tax=Brevibacillus fluminis TaxID=511487 RepID=UPI003F8B7251
MDWREKAAVGAAFVLKNVACSVFQLIVLGAAVVLQFILWLFCGQLTAHGFAFPAQASDLASYISWSVIFVGYAFVWYVFWWMVTQHGGRWFYWKMAFATIPLVAGLILFNPQQDPQAMIPLSAGEMKFRFSTIATGTVLFPLYAIALRMFVFQGEGRSMWKRAILAGLVIVVIGCLVFAASWHYVTNCLSFPSS